MTRTMITTGLRAGASAVALLLLVGCASYDGSSLVAGTSTATDVQTLMGAPAEKVKLDSGATEWFYPRWAARQSFAITIGSDGRFVSSQQRLDREFFDRIRAGTWNTGRVRALLGPPFQSVRFERQKRDVWTYQWVDFSERRLLHVQFSYDGVVREVLDMLDDAYLPLGPGVLRGGLGFAGHLGPR